ncbi:unnamed protein product [Lathyrus sativus]|nr:unnamed protein product [Lathyrus sativus]
MEKWKKIPLSKEEDEGNRNAATTNGPGTKKNKWIRKPTNRKVNPSQAKKLELEIGKHKLVDVMVVDGTAEGYGSGEKKMKSQAFVMDTIEEPEVVLEAQRCLPQ